MNRPDCLRRKIEQLKEQELVAEAEESRNQIKRQIEQLKLFALVAKGELDMIKGDWQGWGDDFWWNWPVSLHLSELIREFFGLDSLPNNVNEFLVQPANY